jgi:hypothetical protein
MTDVLKRINNSVFMPEAGKPTGKIYLKISFYGERM